ncbi:MAG: hypothetical protein QXJ68_05565 [Methanocellales archaeon]
MGLFNALFARHNQSRPKLDQLFAISTACITLESKLELKCEGKAGICIKPVESARFSEIERELKSLLELAAKTTGTNYKALRDEYNYLWIILEDKDFEDLVTTIHMLSQSLIEGGFQDRILCAVFKFKNQAGRAVYWIYSYKQGKFYPFIPLSEAKKQRDSSMEFKLKAAMEKELPVEAELEKWYPLWNLPL